MTLLDIENLHPGYHKDSLFAAECGGPRRQKSPKTPGLNIQPGENLEALTKDTGRWPVMFIWGPGGGLFLLSGSMVAQPNPYGLVERLDPETLETLGSTDVLPCGGHIWCGAMIAHANGDLYAINGNYVHRLSEDLKIKAERQLPADRPYNGILVMSDGTLVTKELRLDQNSTMLVLNPETLEVVQSLEVPQPSMGRISNDLLENGTDQIYVPGRTHLFRYAYKNGSLKLDETWQPKYREENDQQGLAWDTCLGSGQVWMHDNGDTFGVRAIHAAHPSGSEQIVGGIDRIRKVPFTGPVHTFRFSMSDVTDTEVVAQTGGAEGWVIAPPVYVPTHNILIGFDTGNGGLTAYRYTPGEELKEVWRSPIQNWWQPLVYADTAELVVNDYKTGDPGDSIVVLDLLSGQEKARVLTRSPFPNGMFPCPGHGRDVYYASMPSIARIKVI